MYKLVGHRGFPAQYPENTLVSIEAAINTGVKAIEFDVQCSADGTAYVFHDESLVRLTGLKGTIYLQSDHELSQLSAHYPERYGEQFIGEPICSLKDMMGLLNKYPEVEVFIEPKSHSIEYFGIEPFMDTILCESADLGERRRIISFHQGALAYARHAKTSNRCDNIVWVIRNFSAKTARIAKELSPNTLCVDVKLLPEKLPKWLDCHWMIYPMDNPDMLKHYTDMGVEYIETDNILALINP